jgi:hypothetical protein
MDRGLISKPRVTCAPSIVGTRAAKERKSRLSCTLPRNHQALDERDGGKQ